eukprot:271347_1
MAQTVSQLLQQVHRINTLSLQTTNYKKTKHLRMNNEKLLNINKEYIQQITELSTQVSSQKNTIIRQNKHLLKLRTERDDFADVVEEQLQEKRITEKYGVSPLTLLNSNNNNNNN